MRRGSTHTRRARRGFTLLEMVVVIWALGICLLFGTALIVTMLQTNRAGEAAVNRVSRHADLARQFRDDVAAADAVPDKFGEFTSGPTCLILTSSGGPAVVYQWANGSFERLERDDDKKTRRQRIPLGGEGTAVEFARPKDRGGVVTMRIAEPPPTGHGSARRSELSAVLGGNRR